MSAAQNYDGPDPSVECAYPPCTNRLRHTDYSARQWCSKEHRTLTLNPSPSAASEGSS